MLPPVSFTDNQRTLLTALSNCDKSSWLKSDLTLAKSSYISQIFWSLIAKRSDFLRKQFYGVDLKASQKMLTNMNLLQQNGTSGDEIDLYNKAVKGFNRVAVNHQVKWSKQNNVFSIRNYSWDRETIFAKLKNYTLQQASYVKADLSTGNSKILGSIAEYSEFMGSCLLGVDLCETQKLLNEIGSKINSKDAELVSIFNLAAKKFNSSHPNYHVELFDKKNKRNRLHVYSVGKYTWDSQTVQKKLKALNHFQGIKADLSVVSYWPVTRFVLDILNKFIPTICNRLSGVTNARKMLNKIHKQIIINRDEDLYEITSKTISKLRHVGSIVFEPILQQRQKLKLVKSAKKWLKSDIALSSIKDKHSISQQKEAVNLRDEAKKYLKVLAKDIVKDFNTPIPEYYHSTSQKRDQSDANIAAILKQKLLLQSNSSLGRGVYLSTNDETATYGPYTISFGREALANDQVLCFPALRRRSAAFKKNMYDGIWLHVRKDVKIDPKNLAYIIADKGDITKLQNIVKGSNLEVKVIDRKIADVIRLALDNANTRRKQPENWEYRADAAESDMPENTAHWSLKESTFNIFDELE